MSNALLHHVFYADRLYGTYTFDEWEKRHNHEDIPDGAYLLLPEGPKWYIRRYSAYLPMDIGDVSLACRALALLLT